MRDARATGKGAKHAQNPSNTGRGERGVVRITALIDFTASEKSSRKSLHSVTSFECTRYSADGGGNNRFNLRLFAIAGMETIPLTLRFSRLFASEASAQIHIARGQTPIEILSRAHFRSGRSAPNNHQTHCLTSLFSAVHSIWTIDRTKAQREACAATHEQSRRSSLSIEPGRTARRGPAAETKPKCEEITMWL